jgi:hypothetical protein
MGAGGMESLETVCVDGLPVVYVWCVLTISDGCQKDKSFA